MCIRDRYKSMAFRKDNKIKSNFSKISIGLASHEEILENSSGEVLKTETINSVSYTHLDVYKRQEEDYSPLYGCMKGTTAVMFCNTANAPAKLDVYKRQMLGLSIFLSKVL